MSRHKSGYFYIALVTRADTEGGQCFRCFKSNCIYNSQKSCTLIVKYMGPNLIKLPTAEDEVRNLASRFYTNHSFPQCIGAIDCTHVPTKQPLKKLHGLHYRKGYASLNIQALCNYNYCFLNVVIKWPGSVHDSRIFKNSPLNHKFRSGEIPTMPG